MPITKGFQALVDEAMAQVTTHSVAEVQARLADPSVQIVDIRDPRELEREGTVPGALLAPRGMLEFWVDPVSPYFKPVFADESKQFILFCGAGWRSALAVTNFVCGIGPSAASTSSTTLSTMLRMRSTSPPKSA